MKNSKQPITLAYSVDSDDLFMFYALLEGKIDTKGFVFEHQRQDTMALNELAAADAVDITAVSIRAYADICDNYLLLPHGGSIGVNYGPLVLSREPLKAEDLAGKKISIPGFSTTAYLVFKLICPDFTPQVIPISPFEKTFDALRAGEVEAAVVIHEGNLTYKERGFHKVLDLGQWWWQKTGLPLPLGGNVIRKDLGTEKIKAVSSLLRESIAYALDNRDEVIDYLLARETRKDPALNDRKLLDRYLDLYANQDTLEYPEAARTGIVELFKRGLAAGIIDKPVTVEFAP
ncbi:MAG: ABC transporter substrate-binding protein [Deltaproteobacteria bacterium]|nr:ABC transporter substrate-binding protein [Deltaproteobacteria bacterium]